MVESQSLLIEMQPVDRGPLDWAAPSCSPHSTAAAKVGAPMSLSPRDSGRPRFHPCRCRRSHLSGVQFTVPLGTRHDRWRPGRRISHAWQDQMKQLLSISPPDDRRGCKTFIGTMARGATSTYSSAMAAAQLFASARKSDTDIEAGLGRGDFTPLMRWLRTNVHNLGARFTTNEILERATGRPLDPSAFKEHLKIRYLEEAQ